MKARGCGAAGKAIASDTSGSRLQCHPQQNRGKHNRLKLLLYNFF